MKIKSMVGCKAEKSFEPIVLWQAYRKLYFRY